MNGVILSSVGSGLIITAFVMKNSMKHLQKEQNTQETANIKAKLILKEQEENIRTKKDYIEDIRPKTDYIKFV